MKMVSRKQSHQISAAFQTNIDWDSVPFDIGQKIIEDPSFGAESTRFLQNGGRVNVFTTNGIIPPPGGRILILLVVVDESRSWKDAVINAAAPDTGRDWPIWKVGDQYPPVVCARPSLKQAILVNFCKGVQSKEVLAWGKEQKLKPTTPRVCFAITKYYPELHLHLDINPMAVVALMQCSFRDFWWFPCVWLHGDGCFARLFRFDNDWRDDDWFAFECE